MSYNIIITLHLVYICAKTSFILWLSCCTDQHNYMQLTACAKNVECTTNVFYFKCINQLLNSIQFNYLFSTALDNTAMSEEVCHCKHWKPPCKWALSVPCKFVVKNNGGLWEVNNYCNFIEHVNTLWHLNLFPPIPLIQHTCMKYNVCIWCICIAAFKMYHNTTTTPG